MVASANDGVYAQLLAHGAPISFQTARSAAVGDLPAVLGWVVRAGGHAVELPFGHGLDPKRLARYDDALRANAS